MILGGLMIELESRKDSLCLSCKSESDVRSILISLDGRCATVINLCDRCITSLYIDMIKIKAKDKE